MSKSELSQSHESRAQSADFSKAIAASLELLKI